MSDVHRLELAIVQLSNVRQRPGVFFLGGIDGAISFLWGYSSAIWAMISSPKLMIDYKLESQAKRGRKVTSAGPVPEMRERGWSEDAIVDELICIEIDAIARLIEDKRRS